MIDRTAERSVSRQAILLGISRGSIYHQNRPVSDADLKLMHRTRKLHMEFPFAGSRMLQGLLVQEGFSAGRLHVATLMRRMGIEALYRKPNASKPAPGHKIYPYPARGNCRLPGPIRSGRWTSPLRRENSPLDCFLILLTRMARGFIYLAAVLDWFTRRVLSWRVSITLEADFCIESCGGGTGASRKAGNLQYRPGQPVHFRRLHQGAGRGQDKDQHGRKRGLAG